MAGVQLEHVVREYTMGRTTIRAVDDISFTIPEGKYTIILGASGAGKSTVLNILGGMDSPTSGRVTVNGREISGFNKRQLTEYRRESIGFVFQFYNLMPNLTVLENVELPLLYAGVSAAERHERAIRSLERVGLADKCKNLPSQLSGGMKQRAGIARAYTNNPEIMLMDEPFGQLDAQTRYSMQDEVLRIWESEKRTFIFVTNNIEEALYLADRIVLLTNYPAQVKEIYDINLPRPRDTVSPEFLRLRKIISDNTDLAL